MTQWHLSQPPSPQGLAASGHGLILPLLWESGRYSLWKNFQQLRVTENFSKDIAEVIHRMAWICCKLFVHFHWLKMQGELIMGFILW